VTNQDAHSVVFVLTAADFKVADPKGVSGERYLKASTAFWDDGGGKRISRGFNHEPLKPSGLNPMHIQKPTHH
jgi:hypothetical protein